MSRACAHEPRAAWEARAMMSDDTAPAAVQRALRRMLVPFALAVAIAGCGGGGEDAPAGDEDQVVAAIETAYAAFAEGDAEAFCAQLTADYRADFEDYYGPCEPATLEKAARGLGEAERAALADPEIGRVRIEGDSAYPDVNGDGLEVVRDGGAWRLDDFDLPG
jgi:hypothetical protein